VVCRKYGKSKALRFALNSYNAADAFLPEAFDLSGLLLAIMKRTQLRKRASIFEFKNGSDC
jgi:hypothetical protein